MQDARGINPYKFGFGAASDSHNTAVPYRQENFFGGHTFTDGTPEARMSGTPSRRHVRRAHREHRGPHRRLGRREHARVAVRGDAAQGDLRRQRPAHQGAPVRRVGVRRCRSGRRRLGEDRLRERRADGRRPAAGQGQGADVHGVGGEGPDLGQPRPHPDRQGLERRAARASRRSSTSCGQASASPTSGPAWCRRSATRWTSRTRRTRTRSARSN